MSIISLGNFSQSNGRTVLSGSQSRIDTEGLIKALTEARRIPATRLEAASKRIDTQTAAFTSFRALLNTFQTASNTLRNPPGVGNQSQNIFEYRTAAVTTNTGASASSFIDVTAQPGAAIQNFTITNVTSLAAQTKQQTGDILLADATTASAVTANGSPVAGLFRAGTVNLRAVDGSPSVALSLNEGDSLQTVANKFNAVRSQTGIQASIVTVSTGSPNTYKIIFSSTKTGTDFGFDLETTGVVSDASGVLSQIAFSTTQTAANAALTIDGVPVTRQSNAIDDLLTGVTINLKQPTAGTLLQVNVQADTELVQNAITQFADAYNAIRIFAAEQSEVDENGVPLETAVLGTNTTFRGILNTISNEASRVVQGITGGDPTRLIDIGISTDNFAGDSDNPATTNIFTIDADKLSSALTANFDGVRRFFEYQLTSNNPNFITFSRGNQLNASDVTFSIDQASGKYKATYTDLTTGAVNTVDLTGTPNTNGVGVTLVGQAGTALEGVTFLYTAAGDASITAKITQGIGDRFFNALNGFTDTRTGTIETALTDLASTKTRNQTEITRIDDAIVRYRDQLVQQYANLESALSRANSILQLLDSQANARNANN